jgi:hypothetical protein
LFFLSITLTASQLVAIATCSDTGSHNRLDLIQSLVPPHYVYNGYVFIILGMNPFPTKKNMFLHIKTDLTIYNNLKRTSSKLDLFLREHEREVKAWQIGSQKFQSDMFLQS